MGVSADAVLGPVSQLDDLEHLLDPRARIPAVVVGEQVQVLAAGQVGVEPRALDEPRYPVECLGALNEGIAAEEPRGTGTRADQAEQHPQERRLAGAVRAEIPEDVPTLDGQVDPVHRDELAIPLDQAARRDRRRFAHCNARAADSAAAGGKEPTSTNDTPFRVHWIAVPS